MADIPGGPSTTTVLQLGGSLTSMLEVAGDRDWIKISLDAGQSYQFTLDGTGAYPVANPTLTLRDSRGAIVATDDDSGSGLNALLTYTINASGTYYLEVGAYRDDFFGSYQISANRTRPLPEFTDQKIAHYLTNGFWAEGDRARHSFASETITYDVSALTSAGRVLAFKAMATWSAVSGLEFVATRGPADITFDDSGTGAYANYESRGSTTTSAFVNVSTGWLAEHGTAINGYSFQAYIHEIGHALGLGHAGAYNGFGNWSPIRGGGGENHYINDSWQATVMSYFDQDENSYVDASFAYVIGPMMADILAIQDLYGVPTDANAGGTVYGFHSTADGYFNFGMFAEGNMVAFTIFDSSGIDRLDASGFSGPQTIDLRAGSYSDIGGEQGNIGIAANTLIENAKGGRGDDSITGNHLANGLIGNAGNDVLRGGNGSDDLRGGNGNDSLFGGGGGDFMIGGRGADSFAFTTAINAASSDDIGDFNHIADTLRLSKAIFAVLEAGRLAESAFKDLGDPGARVDADDRILYDSDTGALYYDRDGSGARYAAVQFATLTNRPTDLGYSDFVVFSV